MGGCSGGRIVRLALLAVAALLGVVAVTLAPPCVTAPFAQAGCCKQRSALNAPWIPNNQPFPACEARNREIDRDDVFAELGLVWWDSLCRR
jgi:hypothetical protein